MDKGEKEGEHWYLYHQNFVLQNLITIWQSNCFVPQRSIKHLPVLHCGRFWRLSEEQKVMASALEKGEWPRQESQLSLCSVIRAT